MHKTHVKSSKNTIGPSLHGKIPPIHRETIRKSRTLPFPTPLPPKSAPLLLAVVEAGGQGCGHSLTERQSCLKHLATQAPCWTGPRTSVIPGLLFKLTNRLGPAYEIWDCPGQTAIYGHPTYKAKRIGLHTKHVYWHNYQLGVEILLKIIMPGKALIVDIPVSAKLCPLNSSFPHSALC